MSESSRSLSTAPYRCPPMEHRLFLLVMSTAVPAALLWLMLISGARPSGVGAYVILAVVVGWIAIVARMIHREILRQLRTLSNLVESIRMQDYGMKSARARSSGELAGLYRSIDALANDLKVSRQSEQDLLRVMDKVVSEISVAVLVFDSQDRIRLANGMAYSLLRASGDELTGVHRADTVIAKLDLSAEPKVTEFEFPGGQGRWQIRQHYYRHQGLASRIVFIADLKQVLADEQIHAWQRLIRVISHEVNNSLTPIISLCQTLSGMLAVDDREQENDVHQGLDVISERARGLRDFISRYARVARLPEPDKILFPAAQLADRLRRMNARGPLEILAFPEVELFGDPVQLEHALINLVKNAVEATAPSAQAVRLSCIVQEGHCEFRIDDHGTGIDNPDNLFVPFYTTKAGGAGIGLILCRQIALGHHGRVDVVNRADCVGATATFILPLPPTSAMPA